MLEPQSSGGGIPQWWNADGGFSYAKPTPPHREFPYTDNEGGSAMNREIITITDEGTIIAPDDPNRVRMTIVEIAGLLGIFYPTAQRHIRAIEKSGIADGDYKMTCIAGGMNVRPEYYGIEMITALSFRVKSWQADTFRRWLMERASRPEQKPNSLPPISVFVPMGASGLPN